jgi:hypothetical protein
VLRIVATIGIYIEFAIVALTDATMTGGAESNDLFSEWII